MSSNKSPSVKEMREIRKMCRQLGKARGRISRKYSYKLLYEMKYLGEKRASDKQGIVCTLAIKE